MTEFTHRSQITGRRIWFRDQFADKTAYQTMCSAKSRLLINHPFWGFMGLDLVLVEAPHSAIPTMATDGYHIFYSASFVNSLRLGEVEFGVAHEIYHCIFGHTGGVNKINRRREDWDPRRWNRACVTGNTLITMENGDLRRIVDITAGDKISGVGDGNTVIELVSSGVHDTIEIELECGYILTCTSNHEVLTDAGFKNAGSLSSDDYCYVDTRYGRGAEKYVEHTHHTDHSGSSRIDVSTSGSSGISKGSISSEKGRHGGTGVGSEFYDRSYVGCRFGVSGRIDGWRGDDYLIENPQQGEKLLPSPGDDNEHLPFDAKLANGSRDVFGDQSESSRKLVFHNDYEIGEYHTHTRKDTTISDHEKKKSMLTAGVDIDSGWSSDTIHTYAENARNSGTDSRIEFSRVKQIRNGPREDTFDLITTQSHYIAGGIVIHNCDYVINADLKASGVGEFITTIPILFDKKFAGMGSEEVYLLLEKEDPQPNVETMDVHIDFEADDKGEAEGEGGDEAGNADDGNGGGAGDPTDGSGDGRCITVKVTQQHLDDEALRWEQTAQRAVAQAIQGGTDAGTIPAHLLRLIKGLDAPKIHWSAALRKFVVSIRKSGYSYETPDKKTFGGWAIMPAFRRTRYKLILTVAIDTSGSIGDVILKKFMSELMGIVKAFKQYEVHVFCFEGDVDDRTYSIIKDDGRSAKEQLLDYVQKVAGGGGTNFQSIWDFIRLKKITTKGLIVFTDGYANDTSWHRERGIPTLFVTTDNPEWKAPFGRTVPFESM